ncbi:MAG: T9SS type A sorting domain-containing protein, partial [Candidatus Coatesbacteria bacterium]
GSSPVWSATTYRGPSPGSEPENQVVMGLAESYGFISAISFHSYGEYILKPWSYIDDYTDDDELFDDMMAVMNEQIYEHLGHYYTTGNSMDTLHYLMNGEFSDYMYGEFTTLAVTVELNSSGQGGFYPDEYWIEPTCEMMNDVLIAWASHFYDDATGTEIVYFTGEWNERLVELSWDVSERSTFAGFNLYREPGDGSGKTLINEVLITGEPPFKYLDTESSPALSYDYYLEALDESGATTSYGPVHLDALGGTKTVFALYPTRPNPARDVVAFGFTVPEATDGELAVYDITGRKVETVAEGPFDEGYNEYTADLSDLPSGIYVYRLVAGTDSAAKKIVVNR